MTPVSSLLMACLRNDRALPEQSNASGEWKRMPEMDRLVIVRTLRPERLTAALSRFVAAAIGQQYITSQPFSLERSFQVKRFACHPEYITLSIKLITLSCKICQLSSQCGILLSVGNRHLAHLNVTDIRRLLTPACCYP